MTLKRNMTRRERYKMTVQEVHAAFGKNSRSCSVLVPTRLWEEWQRRKKNEGMKAKISTLVGDAMAFGLMGPHPYSDPVEGLKEALDFYSEEGRTERDRLIQAIRGLCRNLGISPEELIDD